MGLRRRRPSGVCERLPEGGPPRIAITIDDGPLPESSLAMLDVLTEAGVPAAFFVIGEQCETHPHLVRAMVDAGMTVGVHGWSHDELTGKSNKFVTDELTRSRDIIREAGAEPRVWRPPYGAHDRRVRRCAEHLGLKMVMWDADPWDWENPGTEEVARRASERMTAGSIVILHDRAHWRATTAALREIIRDARARGYGFASLADEFPSAG